MLKYGCAVGSRSSSQASSNSMLDDKAQTLTVNHSIKLWFHTKHNCYTRQQDVVACSDSLLDMDL